MSIVVSTVIYVCNAPASGESLTTLTGRAAQQRLAAMPGVVSPYGQARRDIDQLRGLDRFGGVRLEAGAEGAEAVLGASQSGEGHRRDGTSALESEGAHLLDQPIAVLVRHSDVADQEVRLFLPQERQRFARRGRGVSRLVG